MTFFFVLKGQEITHNTLLFQSMFLPFSWHKLLLFSFWKQGKSFITLRFFNSYFRYFLDINDLFSFWKHGNWFITLCYFSSCFLHFLDTNYLFSYWKKGKFFITIYHFIPRFCYFHDKNDFCFRSGRRGSYSTPFAISIHVSAFFKT